MERSCIRNRSRRRSRLGSLDPRWCQSGASTATKGRRHYVLRLMRFVIPDVFGTSRYDLAGIMGNMADGDPVRCTAGGIVLAVRATPKARREGIEGVIAGPRGFALKIAVGAAPADGRANARLIEILAEALDVPKSAVSIRAGAASRDKLFFVAGEPGALARTVASLASAESRTP